MITFSIHHQWWWWRWKSCHRSLVSPPGWLSSGDLRWQFACRRQPPSAPTRGLCWKLASSAGWARRQVQTWSRRCNRNCATCHLATWALHKHQHRSQFFWAWVFLPNPILDRYYDDGFLLSSAWGSSTNDGNEHIINLACKLLSMLWWD